MTRAIDFHVHPRSQEFIDALGPRAAQMAAYFGREIRPTSMDQLADEYRARDMIAVLMNSTDVVTSGLPAVPNDVIARAVTKHPDVFVGFGIVEPRLGRVARDEVRRCAEELGLRGIGELNPGRQHFFPNDPEIYGVWEEAAKHQLMVLFHTGMMGAGARTPGGSGFKLKYTKPIPHLDDVAADFPSLKIIGAHPSWPWHDESLAIATHKSNYYIDLSGWAPKRFPESVVVHANRAISDKVLFGSDWPLLTPERWMDEFSKLPFSEETRSKVLFENAAKLLGVETGRRSSEESL